VHRYLRPAKPGHFDRRHWAWALPHGTRDRSNSGHNPRLWGQVRSEAFWGQVNCPRRKEPPRARHLTCPLFLLSRQTPLRVSERGTGQFSAGLRAERPVDRHLFGRNRQWDETFRPDQKAFASRNEGQVRSEAFPNNVTLFRGRNPSLWGQASYQTSLARQLTCPLLLHFFSSQDDARAYKSGSWSTHRQPMDRHFVGKTGGPRLLGTGQVSAGLRVGNLSKDTSSKGWGGNVRRQVKRSLFLTCPQITPARNRLAERRYAGGDQGSENFSRILDLADCEDQGAGLAEDLGDRRNTFALVVRLPFAPLVSQASDLSLISSLSRDTSSEGTDNRSMGRSF
jgi:hypothetical protein